MSSAGASRPGEAEVDVRLLTRSLFRALPAIIVFVLLAGGATFAGLKLVHPTFVGEAKILIETGELGLTRTPGATTDTQTLLDSEGIQSQVQLMRSRDLARTVAAKLGLGKLPEFDAALREPSELDKVLTRFGLVKNLSAGSAEERVLSRYYDRLDVYAVDKTRVLVVDFTSTDPDLAALGANTVAEEYILLQQSAKRDINADATKWLESQIADLRVRVRDAEAKVEAFRASSDLLKTGADNTSTLAQQQLTDLNAELGRVRATRTAAQAKADQIRAGLQNGAALTSQDVLNSPLIQNLSGQQVTLRATIAQLSATLLPGHPKIKELTAQLNDLEGQIRAEAQKILVGIENDAKLAQAREAQLNTQLVALKADAARSNDAQVQLRALERDAASNSDLLDTYLKQEREAASRQSGNYLPADARIISRASSPIEASFPKTLPMTGAAMAAIFLLACIFVVIRELVSGRPMRSVHFSGALPIVPGALPVGGRLGWQRGEALKSVGGDPSVIAAVVEGVERSLAAITHAIVGSGAKRVLVVRVPLEPQSERPLAAVVLARSLARGGDRVILVDLHGDEIDRQAMGGEGGGPGLGELFASEATFAQVIMRDRGSPAHFIPSGRKALPAKASGSARIATLLDALDQTYDRLVLDAEDDTIEILGPTAAVVVLVTEVGAADPRTVRAYERVSSATRAEVLLLLAESAPMVPQPAQAAKAA